MGKRLVRRVPRDGHASYRAMTQYVPHTAIRWCHRVTPPLCIARACRFMRAPPFDLEPARRAARGVVRCTRAAFADRFLAAQAGGATATPAWNMRWPSCAAKPDNDREMARIVTLLRGGAPGATR